jgi:hypothetical protein
MKCKIFWGRCYEAQDAFNRWAEGKALSRDVLIHTIPMPHGGVGHQDYIAIVVFHPESAYWDSTKNKPIQRIQPETTEDYGLERETKHVMLAPIHDKPEPHIKVEEMQVI